MIEAHFPLATASGVVIEEGPGHDDRADASEIDGDLVPLRSSLASGDGGDSAWGSVADLGAPVLHDMEVTVGRACRHSVADREAPIPAGDDLCLAMAPLL